MKRFLWGISVFSLFFSFEAHSERTQICSKSFRLFSNIYLEGTSQKVKALPKFAATPNPFSGILRFQFVETRTQKPTRIRVFDITGRLVADFSQKARSNSKGFVWDSNPFPSGLYLAKLESGKNVRFIEIVKVK